MRIYPWTKWPYFSTNKQSISLSPVKQQWNVGFWQLERPAVSHRCTVRQKSPRWI